MSHTLTLCSGGLNTTMEHSAGMNRRVGFEAGLRFSRLACARMARRSNQIRFDRVHRTDRFDRSPMALVRV